MAYWLEYEARDTPVHKGVQTLTKLVIFFGIGILAGLWWDPRYQLLLVLPAIALILVAKVPLGWFKVVALAIATSIYPVTLTAIGQTNPELFKVLDRAWASTPILVATIPVAGRVGLTYGALTWLLAAELRTLIVACYAFVFIFTTSVAELSDTLLMLKVPRPIVFVVSISYKLIPQLQRVVDQILCAQRLRGWTLRYLNPVKIVRRAMPLMKPLMRRTAMLTEQITVATEIRAFGTGNPTPTRRLVLNRVDYVLIAIMAVVLLISLYGLFAYQAGML